MTRPSRSPLLLAVLAALSATACSRVGTAEPAGAAEPSPVPAAPTSWQGTLALDGKPTALTVDVAPDPSGGALVHLVLPALSLNAAGEGSGTADGLRARLRYDEGGSCPGTITLDLRFDQRGEEASGSFEAKDCTGTESGPVALRRRTS